MNPDSRACHSSPAIHPLGAAARWLGLVLGIACFATRAAAVTFTANTLISETNTTYDGQDIIVDGAIVSIDGPHSFASVTLNNGAVLTHSACTATATHKLDVNVLGTITVIANSRIDATGKGYMIGWRDRSLRLLLLPRSAAGNQ